jgi:hypothetical protein
VRVLAVLVALVAALGGSYGAFAAMRAVGPENRAGEFGYGDAALTSPGGGDLLQSRNFARVKAALERELGPGGAISYLRLERDEARATARVEDRLRDVAVDASGRSKVTDAGEAEPAALLPVAKLDPAAIDTLVRAAQRESGAPVESLALQGDTREWRVEMDGGEPDSWVANLDGAGLRLSGEPNPVPLGGAPDSLLREENLERVLAAAREEAPAGARLTDFDLRPDRVSLTLETGGRELALDYGYDAQLTRRDLHALTGARETPVSWDALDPGAVERMARTTTRVLRVKGLRDAGYVLLDRDPITGRAGLSLYFTEGHDPSYVVADLHGRHLTWPGRQR